MKLKLKNEIELQAGKKSLEILKLNTQIFQGWNKKEISVLSDYMRFFNYSKSTHLAIKGEEVDYFGIIISGRALVQVDSKVYGYVEMGDMIGYMGMIKLPGAGEQHFDIIGEKDGIIAAIRIEDLKILLKKDQIVGYKLFELMNRKAYQTVHYQYKKEIPNQPIELVPSTLAQKRISEMFENNPAFTYFNNVIEKRDQRYLLSSTQLFEFKSEQQIIRQGQQNFILFLLKGEMISFGKGKDPEIYKAGDILGRKEYLSGLNWENNIYGRFSGCFLKLSPEMLQDISLQNSISACNLISLIMGCECLKIKQDYEKEHNEFNEYKKKYQSQEEEKKEMKNIMDRLEEDARLKQKEEEEKRLARIYKKKKDQGKLTAEEQKSYEESEQKINKQKQLEQQKKKKKPEDIDDIFIEIDIQKKIEINDSQKDKILKQFQEYKRSFEIAPLYIHDAFQDKFEKEEVEQAAPTKKKKNDGISTFYKEKISQQQHESLALRNELKMLRKKKLISEEEFQQRLKGKTQGADEDEVDDYEELKNHLTVVEADKREMQQLIEDLKQENLNLRQEILQNNSKNQFLQAKVNKTEFQKELLQKGLRQDTQDGHLTGGAANFLSVSKRATQSKDRFYDVLDLQLKQNRKIQFLTKCAKKWLRFTKQQILRKKIQASQPKHFNQDANYKSAMF